MKEEKSSKNSQAVVVAGEGEVSGQDVRGKDYGPHSFSSGEPVKVQASFGAEKPPLLPSQKARPDDADALAPDHRNERRMTRPRYDPSSRPHLRPEGRRVRGTTQAPDRSHAQENDASASRPKRRAGVTITKTTRPRHDPSTGPQSTRGRATARSDTESR